MSEQKNTEGAVQTTGHAWDGDLQEFNNPLPRWWLWSFYATVVFALIYWVIYPAWPVGGGFTTGVMNSITFNNDKGEEVTTHWNTRSLLIKDMQSGDEAIQQRSYLNKVKAASYSQISADPDMMAFARSYAKGLFGDNCAACHQQGGAGVIGLYPSLADDAWLWGGSFSKVEETLRHGRNGFMPSFEGSFQPEQLDQLAEYVLSLSDESGDAKLAKKGGEIFNGEVGGCYYCHTTGGKGMKALGAANLTDSVWTIANIPAQSSVEGKKAQIKQVILSGVQREMPAWQGRLSDDEIKLLTVYVHELGGGK